MQNKQHNSPMSSHPSKSNMAPERRDSLTMDKTIPTRSVSLKVIGAEPIEPPHHHNLLQPLSTFDIEPQVLSLATEPSTQVRSSDRTNHTSGRRKEQIVKDPRLLLPHTLQNQKRLWHQDSFGMGSKVNDPWGFSSASASRSESPNPNVEAASSEEAVEWRS